MSQHYDFTQGSEHNLARQLSAEDRYFDEPVSKLLEALKQGQTSSGFDTWLPTCLVTY